MRGPLAIFRRGEPLALMPFHVLTIGMPECTKTRRHEEQNVSSCLRAFVVAFMCAIAALQRFAVEFDLHLLLRLDHVGGEEAVAPIARAVRRGTGPGSTPTRPASLPSFSTTLNTIVPLSVVIGSLTAPTGSLNAASSNVRREAQVGERRVARNQLGGLRFDAGGLGGLLEVGRALQLRGEGRGLLPAQVARLLLDALRRAPCPSLRRASAATAVCIATTRFEREPARGRQRARDFAGLHLERAWRPLPARRRGSGSVRRARRIPIPAPSGRVSWPPCRGRPAWRFRRRSSAPDRRPGPAPSRSRADRRSAGATSAQRPRSSPAFLSTSLMMWYPNCVLTRSLICPGIIVNDDLVELRHHPALAEVVEVAAVLGAAFVLRVSSSPARRNRRPPRACFSTSSAFAFTAASSLPSVFRRMWLARTCSGVVYCSMLFVVGRARCSASGTVTFARMRVDVDEQVPDLALFGNPEVGLVRVEVGLHLGVGGGRLRRGTRRR